MSMSCSCNNNSYYYDCYCGGGCKIRMNYKIGIGGQVYKADRMRQTGKLFLHGNSV